MNREGMEKLVEQIDTIFKKELVFEPLNKEKGFSEGFMVFSKEEYPVKKAEELNLGKYPYKKRYYYVEKLNGNSVKNIVFILFNCSTSNPDKLDPTVENCKFLAQKQEYNYSRIEVLNLFSIRAGNVEELKNELDKDGEKDNENYKFIIELLNQRKDCDIVIAWGYGKKNKFKLSSRNEANRIIAKRIDEVEKETCKLENRKKITPKLKNYKNKAYHPGNLAWIKVNSGQSFENSKPFEKYAIIVPYDEK